MVSRFKNLTIDTLHSAPGVHIITMTKPPENRLDVAQAQAIISALRYVETQIKPDSPGAVIISSFSDKFWCTGVDLDESTDYPFANSDGFYPLLATLLDYPYPTIALVTGHTFGGACPLMLACDYRIMNSQRGYINMPPVNLGLHFDGIGVLPRLKLRPDIARKMLLEAHTWKSEDAWRDGIVDEVCPPEKMRQRAVELAASVAPRASTRVYGLHRAELYGEALEKLRRISHVHRMRVGTVAKVKI